MLEDRHGGAATSPDVVSQYNRLNQLGAIDNLEALRLENRELDRLVTDAAALVALPSVPLMLDFVIDKALERFVPTFLAFVIEPPRGNRLSQFCYRNLKPSDETIPLDCYRRIKSRFLSKPFTERFDTILAETGEYPELEAFSPELVFPMRGIDGLYGIVVLGEKVVGNEYSEVETMYLDRLTRFLAVGLQNGLHHQSSITDAKTGLYNHEFFMRRLAEEQARCSRSGAQACILMLDVDRFKRFNDSHGHLAGDAALEALAATLKSTMRTGDAVGRFGGEEFCVLALDCDARGAMDAAERVRRSVESLRFSYDGQELSITVSLGIRMLDPGIDPKDLLDDADKALYASKSGGRNRSTLFRPGLLGRAELLRAADPNLCRP
ncbi:MAG TPA: GGDEF domain-containing protein [Spirochaetales bacterium]|nr:GGDEF domain-containing protein [Spirochaetales bacterium]